MFELERDLQEGLVDTKFADIPQVGGIYEQEYHGVWDNSGCNLVGV